MASARLSEELRGWDDARLVALLRARPDLLAPIPHDIGALSDRATSLSSLARALDRLDRFALQVLDVLEVLPEPAPARELARRLGADPRSALRRLRTLALVWGDGAADGGDDDPAPVVHRVANLRHLLPSPGGLGPPLRDLLAKLPASRRRDLARDLQLATGAERAEQDPAEVGAGLGTALADPARLDALLADLPDPAREVLDRLATGPPTGHLEGAQRRVTIATARTPVDALLARGLLLPDNAERVVLPREIGLHLRGGRVVLDPAPVPPDLVLQQRDSDRVQRTAGSAAFTTLRRVEELLEAWGLDGPPVLKAGGLGVRELRRTAASLDTDEPVAALLVETAYAAGLLGPSATVDAAWLPTPAYDGWRASPPGQRWAVLAQAWFETPRVAGLVGHQDDAARRYSALGPGLDRAYAPTLRREVLDELAQVPDGLAASADSVEARLEWRQPRRGGRLRAQIIAWTLREAELLGALAAPGRALAGTGTGVGSGTDAGTGAGTGAGADSRTDSGPSQPLPGATGTAAFPGATLATGATEATKRTEASGLAEAVAPLLPEPLDYVLLQADLTVIAPGPLTSDLGAELALAADVESRGGATVYRFTPASVRRALDAGRTADDLHRLLAEHSRTPVPQPLTYLVDDVARRHGRVLVGAARAYVRCDDPAVLAEMLADRRTAQLRLRRLAPTVLAAHASVDTTVDRLRAAGYAPAAENPFGEVVVRRPDSRRTPERPRLPRLIVDTPGLPETQLAAVVRALRAGDAARPSVDADDEVALRQMTPWEALRVLKAAAADGRRVWIGYVNAEGRASIRMVEPILVEGGLITAHDQLRGEVRHFALHRITGLAEVPADEPVAPDAAAHAAAGGR